MAGSRVYADSKTTQANSAWCNRIKQLFVLQNGSWSFESGVVAEGLVLIPDEGKAPVTHGVIAPIQVVSITKYQMDLEKTRNSWQIDET
jgi:hypothetical protein